jgi:hypothetical protein
VASSGKRWSAPLSRVRMLPTPLLNNRPPPSRSQRVHFVRVYIVSFQEIWLMFSKCIFPRVSPWCRQILHRLPVVYRGHWVRSEQVDTNSTKTEWPVYMMAPWCLDTPPRPVRSSDLLTVCSVQVTKWPSNVLSQWDNRLPEVRV